MKKVTMSILAIAALCSSTNIAAAATVSGCIVNTIQHDAGRIAIWCAAPNNTRIYYVFGTNYTACNSVGLASSIDTIKIWEDMLQGALLSGKKVDIDYATNVNCSGSVAVARSIRLQRL